MATPFITVEDAIVSEGQGYVDFVVRLNTSSVNKVTVHYSTVDGTAIVGSDYTAADGIVTFNPGETVKTIRIPVFNNPDGLDGIAGVREGFQLVLDSPTNAALSRAVGIATVVDDYVPSQPVVSVGDIVVDEASGVATFVVSLDSPSTGTVTLNYATADGSAKAGLDYFAVADFLSFAPGETVKTVTVNLIGDAVAESDESFDLVLSSVVGASLPDTTGTAVVAEVSAPISTLPGIAAEDAVAIEGPGNKLDFLVRLDAPSADTITVDYVTYAGTAADGTDFLGKTGTITFLPGETIQHVYVDLVDDAVSESPEGMRLALTNPTNAELIKDSAVGAIYDDKLNLPVVSITTPVVDESVKEAVFVITLDRASGSTVTMNYATGPAGTPGDGKATAGSDFTSTAGTLSFAPGETVKTVRVPIVNDLAAEPSELFNFTVSGVSGAYAPAPSATAVIARSDAAPVNTPTISVEDTSFGEAQGYADFIVRLSAPSTNVVSVNYSLSGASALVDNDYIDQSGTLSFAPGETVKTVRIIVVDDHGPTFDETFQLDLKNPVNGVLGRSTGFATIANDDGYAGLPALTVGDVVVDEATQEAVFTLTLNWPSPSVVTLDYATVDGSATAGSDYVAVSGTLSFAPGEVSKTIRVPLLKDSVPENSEFFRLELTHAMGAAVPDTKDAEQNIGAVAVIVADNAAPAATPIINVEDLIIGENQGYADFVVRLSTPGANTVTVGYETAPGSAGEGTDFYGQTGTLSFAPGETVKTVRISLYDDTTEGSIGTPDAVENTESFRLMLKDPANGVIGRSSGLATVIDDDGGTVIPAVSVRDVVVDESAGEAVFTLTLDRPSAGVVSLSYATQDGSAKVADGDYVAVSGALTFAPGEMAKTVRVALVNDNLAEASESFKLVLSGVTGATLPTSTGIATISANDGAAVDIPQIGVDDATAGEGQGYVDFLVRLATPGTSAVGVNYTLADGTATAGSDYAIQTGSLNFAPGEMVKIVRIALSDDTAPESIENFKLVLDSPVNATLGRATGTATIFDNDGITGVPAVSVNDVTVDEAGREAVFTVTLDRPSTGVVTLDYGIGGGDATAGADYTAASGSLAFAPGEISRTVRVSLIEDTAQESSETFNLTLSNVVGGTLGDGTGVATLTDNDSGVLSVGHVVVDEKNGTATFVVSLDRPSTAPVTVDYATADGTAVSTGAEADFTAAHGTLTFAPGETRKTVSVDIKDNSGTDAANETFDLVLSSPVSATLGNPQATAVIVDTPASHTVIPVVSIGDAIVGEGDGYAEFQVRLSAPTINAVHVAYQTLDGAADAGDYTAISDGHLTFNPGETLKTLRVAITDNTAAEWAKSLMVALSNPVNASLGRPYGIGTLIDNDTVGSLPVISVGDPVVDEEAREAVFTITLDKASAATISLDYATGASGDTATAGEDYIATAGHLSFAPGEVVKTVRVPILNDAIRENSELFSLALSNVSNAAAPEPEGQAVIAANDAAPVNTPTLSVEDTSFGEAQAWCDFIVRLSAPSDNLVSVAYSFGQAAAFAGDDYADQDQGILTFAPGETVKTVRVAIVDGYGPTFDETFQLDLKNPVNGMLGRSTGFATIVNDDGYTGQPALSVSDRVVDETSGEAVFTLKLTGPYTQPVTLDYATGGGNATPGVDYTPVSGHLSFAPGETIKTIRVPILDELSGSESEGSETFQLLISNLQGAALPNPAGATPFPVATATIVPSDLPRVTTPLVSVEDLVVGEGQGFADFVVRLDAPSAATVSVHYRTLEGSAKDGGAGNDYWGQEGTLSFAPGEMVKVVRISLNDDTLTDPSSASYSKDAAESTESFQLQLTGAVNAALGDSVGIATVLDNDTGQVIPALSVSDLVVDETSGEAVFVVSLDRPSAGVVSAEYKTVAGSAGDGSDYIGQTGALSFAPGEMAKTVRIPLVRDHVAEASESFTLKLFNSAGATLADPVGTATIAANGDPEEFDPAFVPLISVEDATATEHQGYVDFLVRLNAPSANIVNVDYQRSGGTGINASLPEQVGTLSFASGETVKTVRLFVTDNGTADPTGAIGLHLSNPAGAHLGRSDGVATILDDDGIGGIPGARVDDLLVDQTQGEAVFTVILDRPSTAPAILHYATADGSAEDGSDYEGTSGDLIFAPGEMAKTVRVTLPADADGEKAQTFHLDLTAKAGATVLDGRGTALIAADDGDPNPAALPAVEIEDAVAGEKQGYIDFTVRLSAPGTDLVTVAYATQDGTAQAPGDFLGATGTLAFAPGETVKTLRIAVADDTAAEAIESFQLVLSSPSGAVLGRTTAIGTLLDNDRAAGQPVDPRSPVVSISSPLVDEAAGEAVFTVTLDRPTTGTVTVDYATEDGTAEDGSDYEGAAGTLAFAPGETVKTVRVAVINGKLAEDSETFGLVLDNAIGATLANPDGTAGIAVIAANDGDALATPSLRVEDTIAGEGQGYMDFVVRLDAPGTSAVGVNYSLVAGNALGGGADYTDQAGSLVFAAGETVKTVRVALTDDAAAEFTENFQLVLDSPTGATLARAIGTGTLVDNDGAAGTPVVSVGNVTVDETAGEALFTITLDRPSTGTVVLDYETADGTGAGGALADEDYVPTGGTLAFAPGETAKTIRVPIVNDKTAESDETFGLNLTNMDGADPDKSQTAATATIVANDGGSSATPVIGVENTILGESQGYADFVLRLSAPSAKTVSVGYATVADSALAGTDFLGQTGTISFAPGETEQTVRVAVVADAAAEPSESFKLLLSNPVNGTLGQDTGVATVIDDGTPVAPLASIGDVAVDETSGWAKFTVSLDRPTLDTVTINYETVDGTAKAGSDFTATGGTLTFKPGETTKEIAIPIANDTESEDAEYFEVKLSGAVGATLGDAIGRATIASSDASPPVAVADAATVSEDGSVQIDVLNNDTDPDGGALSVADISTPSYGSVAIGADGRITYTPVADYSGLDQFSYTIKDTNGHISNSATVAVLVVPSNDVPVLVQSIPDQSATANAFFQYTVPLNSFADPDSGDTLAYSARKSDGSKLPDWLTFDPNTRKFTGTPGSGNTGSFDIKVIATDKSSASVFDVFTMTVAGPTPTVASDGSPQTVQGAATDNAPAATAAVQEAGIFKLGADSFPFSPGGSGAQSVTIDSLPLEGRLRLDGQEAKAGQAISRADIDAGHLTYTAPGTVLGDWAQNLTFKLGGTGSTGKLTLNIAPPGSAKSGSGNADSLKGSAKANLLIGNGGDDALDGKGGADRLYGGDGNDIIKGGAGNDLLSGGNGNDRLLGQAGKDTLVGGAGDDVMDGGAGKDVYLYLARALGGDDLAAGTHDVIKATTGDKIGFDADLWASLGISGNTLGSQLDAQHHVAYAGHAIQIDVNGDGAFQAEWDVAIEILGQAGPIGIDAGGHFLMIG